MEAEGTWPTCDFDKSLFGTTPLFFAATRRSAASAGRVLVVKSTTASFDVQFISEKTDSEAARAATELPGTSAWPPRPPLVWSAGADFHYAGLVFEIVLPNPSSKA